MTDLVFVDTNVVIYARDHGEPEKARRAADWLKALKESRTLVVSPQVLNEAVSVSLWKFKDVPKRAVHEWIQSFLAYCTAPLDRNVIAAAIELHRNNAWHWWDCLILASAVASNCRYLLSEDLTHHLVVRTVQIVNPFRVAPSEFLSSG